MHEIYEIVRGGHEMGGREAGIYCRFVGGDDVVWVPTEDERLCGNFQGYPLKHKHFQWKFPISFQDSRNNSNLLIFQSNNTATIYSTFMNLHFRSTQNAAQSIKPIAKNISEMDKELDAIAQVTSTGELRGKLLEADEAKVEIEAILLKRVK